MLAFPEYHPKIKAVNIKSFTQGSFGQTNTYISIINLDVLNHSWLFLVDYSMFFIKT